MEYVVSTEQTKQNNIKKTNVLLDLVLQPTLICCLSSTETKMIINDLLVLVVIIVVSTMPMHVEKSELL
jgi:hypothetical protein